MGYIDDQVVFLTLSRCSVKAPVRLISFNELFSDIAAIFIPNLRKQVLTLLFYGHDLQICKRQ